MATASPRTASATPPMAPPEGAWLRVYKCLCDTQRLRILNLLRAGPLCVCHLTEILGTSQVRVSKQLRYMKDLGLVSVRRRAQWRIYRIREDSSPLLEENLRCLQDCHGEDLRFAEDLRQREALLRRGRREDASCAALLSAEAPAPLPGTDSPA